MVKVPGEPDITQRHSALSLEQNFQQVFQLPLSLCPPVPEHWLGVAGDGSCRGAGSRGAVAAGSWHWPRDGSPCFQPLQSLGQGVGEGALCDSGDGR